MNEQIQRKDGKLWRIELELNGERLVINRDRTITGKQVLCYFITNNGGKWSEFELLKTHSALITKALEMVQQNPIESWIR